MTKFQWGQDPDSIVIKKNPKMNLMSKSSHQQPYTTANHWGLSNPVLGHGSKHELLSTVDHSGKLKQRCKGWVSQDQQLLLAGHVRQRVSRVQGLGSDHRSQLDPS